MAMKVDTKGFGQRQNLVEVLARVKEVLPDSIVLDRALPVSVSPAWKDASVHVFQATGAEGPVSLGWRPLGKDRPKHLLRQRCASCPCATKCRNLIEPMPGRTGACMCCETAP
jgi:hypothetical protein